MAISDELTRIQTAKADIKASIEAKGVTVPSDALIDEYADYVDEISGGGTKDYIIEGTEYDPTATYSGAFNSRNYIVTANIPSGFTSLSSGTFQNYTSLTSVTIPNTVTSISQSVFQSCSSLTNVTIGNGVTSIAGSAFAYCSGLTSITIPDSVTNINGYAFQSCGLTSVTIGNGVTSIGDYAFRNCSRLTSVTINATTPPSLGSNAFQNTNANLVIYVPSESVEAYKAAANWSTYADRIQAIPSE